jgi:hypothetical protein
VILLPVSSVACSRNSKIFKEDTTTSWDWLFYPEKRGSKFLRNVSTYLFNYMVLYPTRPYSLYYYYYYYYSVFFHFDGLGSSACSHSKLINSENWKLYKFNMTPWTNHQLTYTRQHKQNKRRQTSISRPGFEPTTPVSERPKTFHALYHTASVIGYCLLLRTSNVSLCFNSRLFQEFWIYFIPRSNLVRNFKQALQPLNLKSICEPNEFLQTNFIPEITECIKNVSFHYIYSA